MIVCCGEALIDMLPCRAATGEEAFAPHLGGAAFNTAIALGRLGAPVAFFSGISRDLFGTRLMQALAEGTVDLRHVRLSNRPTTLAFVHLADGHASYSFHDENSAGRMLVETNLPVFDASVSALHFSGISLVAEPCGSSYEALMRRERSSRVIMLDPNIRSDFIPDRDRHLARMRRMIAMADIVKLSDEDLDWFEETGSPADIAGRWLDAGPQLVVITKGAEGAAGFTRQSRIDIPAPVVAVADTVGAGDTINAGILAALHERGLLDKRRIAGLSRDDVRTVLEVAVRAAAVTVSRRGANPPWRHELG